MQNEYCFLVYDCSGFRVFTTLRVVLVSDELIRLRAEKPQPGERRTADYIPPEKINHDHVNVVKIGETIDENRSDDAGEDQANSIELNEISSGDEKRESVEAEKKFGQESKEKEKDAEKEAKEASAEEEQKKEEAAAEKAMEPEIKEGVDDNVENMKKEEFDEIPTTTSNGAEVSVAQEPNKAPETIIKESAEAGESVVEISPIVGEDTKKLETEAGKALKTFDNGESKAATEEGEGAKEDDAAKEDDDSNDAVGKEDAAKLDQDLMLDDSESDKEEAAEVTNRKVTIMFQKLLSLGGNSGQMSLRIVDKETAGMLSRYPNAAL